MSAFSPIEQQDQQQNTGTSGSDERETFFVKCFFKSNPDDSNIPNQIDAKQSELYDKASFKLKNVASSAADVLRCKKSMVELGYNRDPFVECFLQGDHLNLYDSGRRYLYWLRIMSVRAPQEWFVRKRHSITDTIPRQIVNLGCGLDTTAFNLLASDDCVSFKYVEIDLPDVTNPKTQVIREDPKIRKLLGDHTTFGELLQVQSDRYVLASSDITKLDSLDEKLRLAGINFSVPTMVVTEFVLAYIKTTEIEALIDYFAQRFPCLCFVDFCTANLDSEFGKREMDVLEQRGIPFIAKEYYWNPSTVRRTYEVRGFVHESMTMQEMLGSCVDPNEKQRVGSIEPIEQSEAYFFEKMRYSYIHISKRCLPEKQGDNYEAQQELVQGLSISTAIGCTR